MLLENSELEKLQNFYIPASHLFAVFYFLILMAHKGKAQYLLLEQLMQSLKQDHSLL